MTEIKPDPFVKRMHEFMKSTGMTSTTLSDKLGSRALYYTLVRGRQLNRTRARLDAALDALWAEEKAKASRILSDDDI